MTTLAALSLHFPLIWYGFLLLFGLALGSFYNVVIYRLPRMLAQTADDEPLTLSTRSSCPQCRQPIAWRDNIPLLSFLWLGRRARCCQARISWSYPLTELTTGLLFILAGALLAPGLALAGGLVLLSFLLILARIDARTQLLPDRLTLPLLWPDCCLILTRCTLPCRTRSPGRWLVIWHCVGLLAVPPADRQRGSGLWRF